MTQSEKVLKIIKDAAMTNGRSLSSVSFDEINMAFLASIANSVDALESMLELQKETNAHLRSIALSLASNQTGRPLDHSHQGDQKERPAQP